VGEICGRHRLSEAGARHSIFERNDMTTGDNANTTRWVMSSDGRDRARASAGSQWKKAAQLQERQAATADYEAARRAQSENMARLKALRLARDAAEALRPAPASPARKVRKKRADAGGLARSLSVAARR
jgi:hypothetical protein